MDSRFYCESTPSYSRDHELDDWPPSTTNQQTESSQPFLSATYTGPSRPTFTAQQLAGRLHEDYRPSSEEDRVIESRDQGSDDGLLTPPGEVRDGSSSTNTKDEASQEHATQGLESPTATWKPIAPPPGYPSINYRPTMMKTAVLLLAASFALLVSGGLVALAFFENSTEGYKVRSVNYYIALRWVPPLLASVSQTVFRLIAREFSRLLPFINMASPNRNRHKTARFTIMARWWPVQYDWSSWGVSALWIWNLISAILISYKTLLVELIQHDGFWTIHIRLWVVWSLAAYYGVTFCAISGIAIWLSRQQTGLRPDWDPDCLADYLALFFPFNVQLHSETDAEDRFVYPVIPEDVLNYSYRLGYWRRCSEGTEKIIYGVRGIALQKVSAGSNRVIVRREQSRLNRARKKPRSPYLHVLYWKYIIDLVCVCALPCFLALLLAAAVTGYLVNGFVLVDWSVSQRLGDDATALTSGEPSHNVATDYTHFFLVAFVFGALPIQFLVIALGQMHLWDISYRLHRSLHNLASQPCLAHDSLLMDYFTRGLFSVTADAFTRSYWKIFVFSIVGAAGPQLALIPVGMLTLTSTGARTVVGQFLMVSSVGTMALCLLLIACYIALFPFMRAWDHERVPRRWESLIDIWYIFHSSELASMEEFGKCTASWTKDHLKGALMMRDYKYRLGIAEGPDGRQRLGADICSKPDTGPTGLVLGVAPLQNRLTRFIKKLFGREDTGKATDSLEDDPAVRLSTPSVS